MEAHTTESHPVRLVVEDDLERNRLTVFFRLLLAIPHLIWITLWTIGIFFVVLVNWFVTLIAGRPAKTLHGWTSAYVRYAAHLSAYLYLTANPYPGFTGEEGEYPIDVVLPGPGPQKRWKTLLRLFLALPALLLASALGGGLFGGGTGGGGSRGGNSQYAGVVSRGALASTCAVLGWFAILA